MGGIITDYESTHNTCHLSDDEFLDAMLDYYDGSFSPFGLSAAMLELDWKNGHCTSSGIRQLCHLKKLHDDIYKITKEVFRERGTLGSLCPISLTYKEDERIKRAKDRYNEHRNDLVRFLEDFRQ